MCVCVVRLLQKCLPWQVHPESLSNQMTKNNVKKNAEVGKTTHTPTHTFMQTHIHAVAQLGLNVFLYVFQSFFYLYFFLPVLLLFLHPLFLYLYFFRLFFTTLLSVPAVSAVYNPHLSVRSTCPLIHLTRESITAPVCTAASFAGVYEEQM